MNDWQTWAAGSVVVLTLIFFAIRILRRKPGCSSGCGCGKEKTNR